MGVKWVCCPSVCVCGQSVWPMCVWPKYVKESSGWVVKWMGGQVDGWSSGSVGGEVGWGSSGCVAQVCVWSKCVAKVCVCVCGLSVCGC